jgi:Fe-S cluster biogenesis protein NfuA
MNSSITYETTPNPQAMKFIVTDRRIASESVDFPSPQVTSRSPLAKKLFGFPWAAGVFIGPNFVTVTKQDWVKWEVLAEPLADLIEEHINRGEAVLLPETAAPAQANDTPVVARIKRILDTDIRPAVAMDGGDIIFHSFENGRLYVRLQGSCSGCPSSTMTLKDGIETRLRAEIPGLVEVVSV